jgi:hypothetical protein
MWGAISYARKTQLVHITDNLSAARYRDEVFHLDIDSINRRILSCGILPILAQEHAAVLAEFAALVDDCARVDPSHPQMFY